MSSCNIFLIGFMGTGKSTVASYYSKMYGTKIVEMDELLASRVGMSIKEIFAEKGEEYFRNLETEFLKGLGSQSDRIVSCGGGAVLRKENVKLMKEQGSVVWLTASAGEVLKRVKDDEERPLLKGRKNIEAIRELMEERYPRYEAAADIVVDTDGKSAEEICIEIKERIKRVKER